MQRKPVDLGNGMVCASFALDGSLLAVGAPHRDVGLFELTGAPAFPPEHDGDPGAVRRHRAQLTDPRFAVLRVDDSSGRLVDAGPAWQCDGDGWSAEVDAWVSDAPEVVQRYRVRRTGAGRFRLRFAGRLDRPGFAEITPVGPIPPTWASSVVTATDATLSLATSEPDPPAHASVSVLVPGVASASWSVAHEGAACLELGWDADADPSFEVQVIVTMGTSPTTGTPRTTAPAGVAPTPPTAGVLTRAGPVATPSASQSAGILDRIATGALRYTLGCTALAVDETRCCILTDHRLLPLSWTRDAYYQAALLLCSTEPEAVRVVRRHLAWLWGPGRDAAGVWQRSHYASGAVKDHAYQPDQQLYPLLELADYRRTTGQWPPLPGDSGVPPKTAPSRWGQLVEGVWAALPRGRGELLRGQENPADDPSTYPYLLSNQLLLAYVGRRLGELEDELQIAHLDLSEDTAQTLASTWAAFACEGPLGPQWAYESDGEDGRRLYHDANDVPTALAPLWGLCDVDDPHWRGTMRFGWSAHNPGFVSGRHAGLGSAHTPGVWPLGDAQQWAAAMAVHDGATASAVLDRLDLVTSDDGMLPETYDPDTGEWLARHWFAWPGALLGLLHYTVTPRTGPWAATG